MNVTRAISIRQPWARAVAIGVKSPENRGRNVTYRGPIAIHASTTPDRNADTNERIVRWFGPDPRLGAATGVVLAVADLTDCHQAVSGCCEPWGDVWYSTARGPVRAWHLVLADARLLDRPVRARGQLSVPWTLPEDVAAEVQAQLDRRVAA